MTERARNVVVFLVVVALHGALIGLVKWKPDVHTEAIMEVYSTILTVDSARRMRTESTRRPPSSREDARAATEAALEPSGSISNPVPSTPKINWAAEGSAAAESVIQGKLQADALRPLISTPKTLNPAREEIEPGIFTLTPPHKPGTFENLGEGITREWTSEYCYWWRDIGPDGPVPREKCLPKFANPNSGNLFKQFRPKYLDVPTHDARLEDEDSAESGVAER